MKYAPYLFCLFWGTTTACGSTAPAVENNDSSGPDPQEEADFVEAGAQSDSGAPPADNGGECVGLDCPVIGPIVEPEPSTDPVDPPLPDEPSPQPEPDPDPTPVAFRYTFDESHEGWSPGFADYPAGQEAFFELESAREPLPDPISPKTHAFKLSGHNHSDDLFMFLKAKVSGLKPNTEYAVHFDLTLASPEPVLSIGAGGSPATSVHLKVGATPTEPVVQTKEGYHVTSIDHGNQYNDGADMVRIGDIGIPGEEFEYTLIRRTNEGKPVRVRSAADGSAWLIIGTDSGFEGKTTLYYDSIQARFEPVVGPN